MKSKKKILLVAILALFSGIGTLFYFIPPIQDNNTELSHVVEKTTIDQPTVAGAGVIIWPADARSLTETEKQMIIDTVGTSYRDDPKTSILESVNLDLIKISTKPPKIAELRALAIFFDINTDYYIDEYIQNLITGSDISNEKMTAIAMSLPNGTIYLTEYEGFSESRWYALLAHEIDHQYLYQIQKKTFEQLLAEAELGAKAYEYDVEVLSLDDIKTLEGQAQYVGDYVFAKIRGKSTTQFKIFSVAN